MSWITLTGNGVRLQVRVQPRSAKNQILGVAGEYLRIKLTAPPVDGEANKMLINFLGEFFGCGTKNVKILKGLTGRIKLVELNEVSPENVQRRLQRGSGKK